MSPTVLTSAQIQQYLVEGYLLVSGLMPDKTAIRAEEAVWAALAMNPDDPSTWTEDREPPDYSVPELLACYTPEYLLAAGQLAEGAPAATLRAPQRIYCLNVFPRKGEWRPHGPHIDHAIREHGHKTFPHAFRVAAMTYLHDIEPRSGATVVWPGSHTKVAALARSDYARYEMMWVLNQDIGKVEIGEPVEVIARRGDVLFYHYLCIHSGSMNVGKRPRFAMNMKW